MSHPWMPFYVGDYLSKTQRLNAAEHGAYMLLILEYWQSRGLPDDDSQLARICRVTEREWAKVRTTVASFFYDGWRHRRIDEELAKADVKHARRVGAGHAGGKASAAAKQSPSNATSNAAAGAQASSSHSQPEEVAAQPLAGAAVKPDLSIPIMLRRGERTRDWFDRLEAECREAAGLEEEPSPSLLDVSPIVTLIDQGFDFARDILPKLRAAKAADKHGRSWAYYVPAITEGKVANGKIAAKAVEPSAKPMCWILRDTKEWGTHALAYRAAYGKDPPAKPGLGGMGWHFQIEPKPEAAKSA